MSSSVSCSPGLPWLMSYLLESRPCACYARARVVAQSPSWQSHTSYVAEKKHPAGVGNARFLDKTHARMDELTPALPGTVAVLMAYGRRCETAVATQTEVTTTATGGAASPCASAGKSLKTFWPTWGSRHLDSHWIGSTTTKGTRRATVAGPRAANKHTTQRPCCT